MAEIMAHIYIDIPKDDLGPDLLRKALAGQHPNLPASKALALTSDLDLSLADQIAFVLEIIQNEKVELLVRAAAVRTFIRLGAESAGPALLETLKSSEERIAAAAAAALGQVGTEKHLSALRRERARNKAGEFFRRRVEFAEALIVHRFGLTGYEVELPKAGAQASPTPDAQPFTSTRPGRDRGIRAIDSIKREFPSLDAARQIVYELKCGPRLLEVVFDRDFIAPDGIEARTKRPGLPGFVAFHGVEEDEFCPRVLLFSSPGAKEGVDLLITTMTGDPVYVGGGSVSEKNSEFELRSVKGPGITPVATHIRLSAAGVQITGVSDRRAITARGPTKMPVKPSCSYEN